MPDVLLGIIGIETPVQSAVCVYARVIHASRVLFSDGTRLAKRLQMGSRWRARHGVRRSVREKSKLLYFFIRPAIGRLAGWLGGIQVPDAHDEQRYCRTRAVSIVD